MSLIKKIKQFFFLFMLLVLLIACGYKKVESKTFVLKNNIVNMTVTYFYKGDNIVKQKTKRILVYVKMGITPEQAKQRMELFTKQYKNLKGVIYKIVFNDRRIIECIEIDYSKISVDELNNLSTLPFGSNIENTSMKKTEKLLTTNGFTEQTIESRILFIGMGGLAKVVL